MSDDHNIDISDAASVREMLLGSGYSEKAIDYYLNRPDMGSLSDADHVTELTGKCGDTMRIYMKFDRDRVKDAKMQVLGCPGAVAAAMAAMELVKGKTIEEAQKIKDQDVFRLVEDLPDQKQHCVRLAIKTMQQALEEYDNGNR
ncbi:MAG: iron-sulfur cluster assembly scaffold protein [Deltaproteobacteria bacterium]|nr:iron-sulfur cluster assembly scaffold protein [Deltaproteobacteria bacterium]